MPNKRVQTLPFNKEYVQKKAQHIRNHIIVQTNAAGSGHPGGSLSAADILATLYFGNVMNISLELLDDPKRDRFILSKGHAAPVLYATLCELGVFPKEELKTLRKIDSRLQGHPDMQQLDGIEVSTGSLGQGLSVACGMAYGLQENYGETAPHVFVLLGDGELQEGQNWEALMFGAHHKLSNLVAIVDNNTLQIGGHCDEIISLGNLSQKFTAFGWNVLEVDGHDIDDLHDKLTQAKEYNKGPTIVVASTIKGKGVSFMENACGWHGKAPSDEETKLALQELK